MDDAEKLVQMMIRCGLATGHGDTIDDLISELEKQIRNNLNAFSDARKQIERLREALREIYEVYAGSEGIPQPMTAAEGYLLSLLMEAVEIASKALCGREQGPRLDDRGSNLDGN